jgi:hypothetical protein
VMGETEGRPEQPKKREPPKPRPVIIRVFRALRCYENHWRRRRNTQHQTNELMMAIWTRRVGLFTGALVVVGGVTACIFEQQLGVMKNTLDELQSEKRPWIAGGGPITPDHLAILPDLQVTVRFQVEVTVLGGSPAYHVASGAILIPEGTATPLEKQNTLCESMKKATLTQFTFFPGQKPTVGIYATDENHAFAAAKAHGETKIFPIIVGCIVYSDQAGHKHQTGFLYDLYRRDPVNPDNVKAFDLEASNVPGEANMVWGADLKFRPDLSGNGPAD